MQRMGEVEQQVGLIKPILVQQSKVDSDERLVIIHHLEWPKRDENDTRDPCEIMQEWCKDVLQLNCVIISVERIMSTKRGTADMVKMELSTLDQKIELANAETTKNIKKCTLPNSKLERSSRLNIT